jgi:hypothetical protein
MAKAVLYLTRLILSIITSASIFQQQLQLSAGAAGRMEDIGNQHILPQYRIGYGLLL